MRIHTPLTDDVIEKLRAGDKVLITGTIYVARDSAHKRIVEAMDRGESPLDPKGQIIYYMGPAPAKPGQAIGSAGPTTSYRMDPFAPRLMAEGLKGMIGKGNRSQPVKDAIKKHKAIYFASTGGAGALIAKAVKKSQLVAYEDLGAEALLKLEVEDFPATVINDIYGGDAYEDGVRQYAIED